MSVEFKGEHWSPESEFKKDQTPWNKGTVGLTQANSGSFEKGRKTWNEGLEGYMAGDKNGMWKGGVTPEEKAIRVTFAYKNWRKEVLKRGGSKCVACGSHKNVHAHHIKTIKEAPELIHEVSNGEVLCKPCHHSHHTQGSAHPFAILSEHKVARIRLMKEIDPTLENQSIGTMFGVHKDTIRDALSGKSWSHVT